MPTGTEGGGSPLLTEFIGHQLGDIAVDDETPDSQDTGVAPGDTPETHPPGDPKATTVPEGTEPAERAGEPPADAATPAPDAPVAEPDPLADAKPLTYTVNGESRTYEGIRILGEDGAVIRAADLPDVMKRLGERDHYFEQSQAQYRAVQHFEKLAEWKTTDADGNEQTFTGHHALVERHVDSARKDAALAVVDALLSDPRKFASLVAVDEKNQVVIDPTALEYLQKDVALAANNAERARRAELVGLVAELNRPAAQATNYAQLAPRVIEQAAGAEFTKLTAEDKAFLTEQMPRYVRDTTPEEKRNGSGQRIVDASFATLVQRTAKQQAHVAKVATVTADATKKNAANLAAAARGVKPSAPAKPATPKPATPAAPSDAESAWDIQEKAAAAALRRRTA